MKSSLVVVGAGGHAKVVIDIFRQSDEWDPVGCVDRRATAGTLVEGVPVMGDDALLRSLLREGVTNAFVAVGDNAQRFRLMAMVQDLGYHCPNAISPYAYIAPSSQLGGGVAIMPGAVVGPDSEIGDGAIINTRASVDHDGVLETCCHVAPGATLAGGVHLEALVIVGAGATVIPSRRIGRGSVVGAGAVVVRDLPAGVVALGVPARVQRDAEQQRHAA